MKTVLYQLRKTVIGAGVLSMLVVAGASAQSSKLKQDDKDYENYAYVEANKIYEQIAMKGYHTLEMFQRLGDRYYFNARYKEAAKWYGELFAISSKQPSEY